MNRLEKARLKVLNLCERLFPEWLVEVKDAVGQPLVAVVNLFRTQYGREPIAGQDIRTKKFPDTHQLTRFAVDLVHEVEGLPEDDLAALLTRRGRFAIEHVCQVAAFADPTEIHVRE